MTLGLLNKLALFFPVCVLWLCLAKLYRSCPIRDKGLLSWKSIILRKHTWCLWTKCRAWRNDQSLSPSTLSAPLHKNTQKLSWIHENSNIHGWWLILYSINVTFKFFHTLLRGEASLPSGCGLTAVEMITELTSNESPTDSYSLKANIIVQLSQNYRRQGELLLLLSPILYVCLCVTSLIYYKLKCCVIR